MIGRYLTKFCSRVMLLFAMCFSLQCNPVFSVKVIQHVDSDEKVRCSRKPKPNQEDSVKFLEFIERNKEVECSLCHKPCVLCGTIAYYEFADYCKYENKEPNFCFGCFINFVLRFEVGLAVTKLKITKNWFPSLIYRRKEMLEGKDGKDLDLLAGEQPLVCVLNKECIYCLEEMKFDLYRNKLNYRFCGHCSTVNHISCDPKGKIVKCPCGQKLNHISNIDDGIDSRLHVWMWEAYLDDRFYDYYNAVRSGTDRIEVLNRYYKSKKEAELRQKTKK